MALGAGGVAGYQESERLAGGTLIARCPGVHRPLIQRRGTIVGDRDAALASPIGSQLARQARCASWLSRSGRRGAQQLERPLVAAAQLGEVDRQHAQRRRLLIGQRCRVYRDHPLYRLGVRI